MTEQHGNKRVLISVLGSVVLVELGLGIALVPVEMLMRAFPNLVPSEVRVNPPARRVKAFIDETYDFRLSDGDLFHHMRGKIVPLSPDQDRVVAQIHMITDENGFRNSPPEKSSYGIVALGDSFTKASGVATPWPQKLAEYAGSDVLNLGDVALGPQDELTLLQQYGLNKQPQWVIMAYFEGNDLYDAAAYEQANPFILFRFGRYILNQGIAAWHETKSDESPAEVDPDYPYPIMVAINDRDLEMAFFSYYMAWLTVDRDAIESSQNYRFVKETMLQVQELSEATEARFVFVYVPSKEHVYLPYLSDDDILVRVFSDVQTLAVDEAGYFQFTGRTATPDLARQYMDDQAELLADFAAGQNILFLDLTPTFQEETGMGAELYYPYDTHWNQQGHDLAGQTIAWYIESVLTADRSK